jgi:hypothetical protein
MRATLVLPLLLVAATLSASCGYALQQANALSGFRSRYGCYDAKVVSVSDGYRVVGCGRIAEYACFDLPSHHHHDDDTSVGAVIPGAMAEAMFAGTNQRCVLAHSESSTLPAPVATSTPSAVRRRRKGPGEIVLRSRALFAGGHLELTAKPERHAEHVLLTVHSVARLPDASCQLVLFSDGLPVAIREQARAGAYDALLVVPVKESATAQQSARFAGVGCGVSFELDASARATLTVFAAHFREQRARLAQMLAGGDDVGAAHGTSQVPAKYRGAQD